MSFCTHCVQGVRHEGNPTGKFEEIGGVSCYVATPKKDYPQDKVLLYLTDVFGIQLVNHQLLADDFALNGFKVVAPTLFANPIPGNELGPGSTFDLFGWLKDGNSPEETEPAIRKVVEALKAGGATRIGLTAYCYGARPGFNLAFENKLDAIVVAHPSFLQHPADFETYKAKAQAPLLINSCEIDPLFPADAQAAADKILGDGQFVPGYKRNYYEGCTHGFASRGDLSNPIVKAAQEAAFKESVEWLIQYL